ncbi:uncharacterized protein EV422DRAFT_535446 [Fimicolochytrium jonesii]|uniref:uncharacterized protein n=1 Tax=Fimicolochytrium jonesii TaxID=1396493 RepID=UPI0022FEE5A7|nr:uncharacterized protein EV422DRAFT_535446 [Fimicolochytrium jonesii]KAI8819196.1 hypothetical protein EV422DRAFT_535446 [Fimicolochytrium jonesii]
MAPTTPFIAAVTGLGAITAVYLASPMNHGHLYDDHEQHPAGALPSIGAGIPISHKTASANGGGLFTRKVSFRQGSTSSGATDHGSDDTHDLDRLASSGSFKLNPEDMLFGCI